MESKPQKSKLNNESTAADVEKRHDIDSTVEQIFTEPTQQHSLFEENNDDELAKLLAEMNTLAH